jgi:hypothetical protein
MLVTGIARLNRRARNGLVSPEAGVQELLLP